MIPSAIFAALMGRSYADNIERFTTNRIVGA